MDKEEVEIEKSKDEGSLTIKTLPRSLGNVFAYSLPIGDSVDDGSADGDELDSNKSTPYFTPMEFCQGNSFEFPSPKVIEVKEVKIQKYTLKDKTASVEKELPTSATPGSVPGTSSSSSTTSSTIEREHFSFSSQSSVEQDRSRKSPKIVNKIVQSASTSSTTLTSSTPSSTSPPVINRKLRRCSLYERRSCSPPLEKDCNEFVNEKDKENTKPSTLIEKDENSSLVHMLTQSSGNNSPIAALIDENTGSPKILGAANSDVTMFGGSGRLTYSPKLLASINNLNLSGSPLGVISSAGYKNGNYFKFPEIDQLAQEETVTNTNVNSSNNGSISSSTYIVDNHSRSRQRIGNVSPKIRCKSSNVDNNAVSVRSTSCSVEQTPQSTITSAISTKNRKNKNNLTIRISDPPTLNPTTSSLSMIRSDLTPSSSPSPKPKTPTIKSTKEKALSLDSAAPGSTMDPKLRIIVTSRNSVDEIDSQNSLNNSTREINLHESQRESVCSNRSTSMSQLSTYSSHLYTEQNIHLLSKSSDRHKGDVLQRSARRRIGPNSEWHQRSHLFNIDTPEGELSEFNMQSEVIESSTPPRMSLHPKFVSGSGPAVTPSSSSSSSLTPVSATSQRGLSYKHNPHLHASNTNLKTLPEFLTLVEFSTTSPKEMGSPYKQKSMELPSTSSIVTSSMRMKNISSTTGTSTTNLLQRRGSNHSLTLNLHGSCSNLLGNCRSGLSISNYSLGSTTNLNSKSSGNLDSTTTQLVGVSQHNTNTSAQVTKQSLFRRRGSNHSLTLTNLTAASCGNLNSFASQNSLNVDRLLPPGGGGGGGVCGVTRTTSFITPTRNTTSTVPTATTPKRGLLERRGSNQSLTLNMGSSFGGIGTERINLITSQHPSFYLNENPKETEGDIKLGINTNCSQHRKFFSSENLNRSNNQFSDLNQTHKRNANQVCFGSVSDLKPSHCIDANGSGNSGTRDHFNFQESTVCTCTGVRNIATRPLSPQTTSEEFKIYLANIQMLQNASNALNQMDLIKLNYIFDNSYLSSNKGIVDQSLSVLNIHAGKDVETPPGLLATTSEDHEIIERFQDVIGKILDTIKPDENEQKRMFCDLHKEFWDLPLNHQEKPMVFGSQTKNRYKTILPNENSRVLLEKERNILEELMTNYENFEINELPPILTMTDDIPYINANYIKGPDYTSKCYVATQGPLPNTIFEFWLMVYLNTQKHLQNVKKVCSPVTKTHQSLQQYYQKIIMLTNFLEKNQQKCSAYFPIELNEIFLVSLKHEVIAIKDDRLNDFLNQYLQIQDGDSAVKDSSSDDIDKLPTVGIEFLKTALNEEQQEFLPKNSNFFAVKNIGIIRKNGFSIRKLIVLYCVNIANKNEPQLLIQRFQCYHYWYPDWPDHRSPRDINTLLDICLHVLNLGKCEMEFAAFSDNHHLEENAEYDELYLPHIQAQNVELYQQDIFNSVQPLPIIHCSAGIGRTGCFTAILNGIRQLRQSLAYSLTSMASAALKKENSTKIMSPVDFCLPIEFMKKQPNNDIDQNMINDTDSSFTRNTLLYLKYILDKNNDTEKIAIEESEDKGINIIISWQLPSLKHLPKMPDVFVDILGIVCNLRLQRGGMVQNSEQYELIHRAICLYMKRSFALKHF